MSVSGTLVDVVYDLSGRENHLSETGSTRPTYSNVHNGHVKFDGATQKLTIPTSLTVNRQAVSIFAVMRRGGHSTATMSLVHFPTAATNLALYHISNTLRVFHTASVSSAIEHGGASTGSASGLKGSGAIEAPWMIGGASNAYIGLGKELYTRGSALGAGSYSGGYIGAWNGLTFPFKGSVKAVLVYNRELTLAEKDEVLTFIEGEFRAVPRSMDTFVIPDGDSLTQGVQSSDEFNFAYPFQCSRLGPKPFKLWNNGLGGAQLTTAGNLAATAPIARLVGAASFTNRVLVGLWGTNDISAGRTDSQVIADINTYISNIRTGDAGAKILFGTILPRGPFNSTQNGYIAAVNTHIRSGATHDGYIEFHDDARLDDPADTAYFDADGIHLNDAGYAAMAELTFNKMRSSGWL